MSTAFYSGLLYSAPKRCITEDRVGEHSIKTTHNQVAGPVFGTLRWSCRVVTGHRRISAGHCSQIAAASFVRKKRGINVRRDQGQI